MINITNPLRIIWPIRNNRKHYMYLRQIKLYKNLSSEGKLETIYQYKVA